MQIPGVVMGYMLQSLKLLLGADDTEDALLTLLLEQTTEKVLAETRQSLLPPGIQALVVEMAADAYHLVKMAKGTTAGEIAGSVSSLSDNGQSISYRDSAYNAILGAVSATLKDYGHRLERWRKVGW